MDSDPGFLAALEEAKAGFEEGGVPIGACLVSKEGKILGRGHNMRVQKGSATLHVGLFLDSRLGASSDRFFVRLSKGRNLDSGKHRPASRVSVQRCYHVHLFIAV